MTVCGLFKLKENFLKHLSRKDPSSMYSGFVVLSIEYLDFTSFHRFYISTVYFYFYYFLSFHDEEIDRKFHFNHSLDVFMFAVIFLDFEVFLLQLMSLLCQKEFE